MGIAASKPVASQNAYNLARALVKEVLTNKGCASKTVQRRDQVIKNLELAISSFVLSDAAYHALNNNEKVKQLAGIICQTFVETSFAITDKTIMFPSEFVVEQSQSTALFLKLKNNDAFTQAIEAIESEASKNRVSFTRR